VLSARRMIDIATARDEAMSTKASTTAQSPAAGTTARGLALDRDAGACDS
jgi:hypothetical protein